jgi:hypothetical protein
LTLAAKRPLCRACVLQFSAATSGGLGSLSPPLKPSSARSAPPEARDPVSVGFSMIFVEFFRAALLRARFFSIIFPLAIGRLPSAIATEEKPSWALAKSQRPSLLWHRAAHVGRVFRFLPYSVKYYESFKPSSKSSNISSNISEISTNVCKKSAHV